MPQMSPHYWELIYMVQFIMMTVFLAKFYFLVNPRKAHTSSFNTNTYFSLLW